MEQQPLLLCLKGQTLQLTAARLGFPCFSSFVSPARPLCMRRARRAHWHHMAICSHDRNSSLEDPDFHKSSTEVLKQATAC